MTSIFGFQGGAAQLIAKKLTDNNPTVIVDGSKGQVNVPAFQVNENAGSTPNLSVELYDVANTTAYNLGNSLGTLSTWKAKAVTAGQSLSFTDGYVVPFGWQLRVTSSDAAGKFDVIGIKIGQQR